jgi:Mn-dependent DtxR family transcriptional regulator
MHTGVIADRVGVSKATASKTLGRLEVDGLVSRVVTGVWTAVLADATTERVA